MKEEYNFALSIKLVSAANIHQIRLNNVSGEFDSAINFKKNDSTI
jgi:hypothetical protein